MSSVEGPGFADEATPLVSRQSPARRDGAWGGLRNLKYAVLTVCIGSLIAVAASSYGAPGTFLGLAPVDFASASSSTRVGVSDTRYAKDPTPYTSRAGTPRVGAAPSAAVNEPLVLADMEKSLDEAAGEIDRSREYASIQADNAEQLDVDFHKSQAALETFTSITNDQLATLRAQNAELAKENSALHTENAEISQEMAWHKSIAVQEREKFLKVGFHVNGRAGEMAIDEDDQVATLTRDLTVMYYELRKTQQKKYENYLSIQKANNVNAKLNVEVAEVTSAYEKLLADSTAAATAAHTQHEAHIKLTVTLHDEIERLESKLRGMEQTHVSETKKVTEALGECSNKTTTQAGNVKWLAQQKKDLTASVAICDTELEFTKTQSGVVTSDLTKQLKATQHEKETLFTAHKAASEKLGDLQVEKVDLVKRAADDERLIETLKSDLQMAHAEKEACVGMHKTSDRTIFDLNVEISNIKGRHNTTMTVVKQNTHALEQAVEKCQDEKNVCIGTSARHAELLATCAERKADLEAQVGLERVAHLEIKQGLDLSLKTCRNSTEMLEGTLEAHGDLLADSKKRTEQLEDQLGVWQTKHAEDTDACAAALKDEQHAKASCVGSYAESDTIIGDLKKTLGALETNLNATTAKLEATVDTCDRTIKSCQGEKQKCVGESAAHAALLADVKENASVLAAKLHTTQGAFEKTTTELTSEIDTCQADKQRCVGESKAAHDLITECVDTRAELQAQLATKAVANAKLAHETSAAMKTCQDEKQTCIGTNKASLTLIADCKATAGDFEDELGATTAALAETTAKFETELKQLQTEKQTCVGQNKASQTVIADLKSATADLENTLNKTTSTLTETAAQCDADVQQLQTEKQACVGHNKASLTLIADCKSSAADFEDKLGVTTAALAETTARCETDVKQLQQEKQHAVGRAAANDEIVRDLKHNLEAIEKSFKAVESKIVTMDLEDDAEDLEMAAMLQQLKELSAAKAECLVKNGAHQTVIDDLSTNVEKCESSLHTTRTTLAETNADSAAKVKELFAAKEECLVKNGAHRTVIDDLESNVGKCHASLNTTRTSLAKTMTETAAAVNALVADKEQLLVRNGAHATIIDDLEHNVGACEAALNTTRLTAASADAAAAAKVKELAAAKETCLVTNGASRTIIDDLSTNVRGCETRLSETVEELTETSANLTSQLTASRGQVKTCVSESGAQSTVIGDLKSNVLRCESNLVETKVALNATSVASEKRIKEITDAKEQCLVTNGAHMTIVEDLQTNVGRCEKTLNTTADLLRTTKESLGGQVKELEQSREFLLSQGGAFKTIIEDLEAETAAAEKKIEVTAAALVDATTTLNAQIKECVDAKASVMIDNGASATRIANLLESVADCGSTLNKTRAESDTARETASAQITKCDAARDACVVKNGAHETVVTDLHANVKRLTAAVDLVSEDLEQRENNLNAQLGKIFEKYEGALSEVKACDTAKADLRRDIETAADAGATCVVREETLVISLAKSNQLKESCTEKHAGCDTKIASLADDVTRLSTAATKEQAAHVATKAFYEKQSGEIKQELATATNAKSAAEAASGKCAASVAVLRGDVVSCNEQIVINQEQVVKDKAFLVTRAIDLDALVSGLRANESTCLVSFSRMENVASSTAEQVTKCVAELNTTKTKVTEITYYAEKMEEELLEIVEELGECQNADLPTDVLRLSPAPAPPTPAPVPGAPAFVTLVQGGLAPVVVTPAQRECDAVKANLTALLHQNWCRPPLRHVRLNPDDSTRAKSCVASNSAPGTGNDQGQLNSDAAWISCANDNQQWYVIDVGDTRTITGVATQSRRGSAQRVTKFLVSTADSPTGPWTYVNNGTVFDGNRYDSTDHIEDNVFAHPVEARFVRIEPTAWNQHISMRAGVLYSPKIGESFALNPDEGVRHYSSVYGNQAPGVGYAQSMLDSIQGWFAARNEVGEWMQIDAGATQTVSGVVMQSRRNTDQMVRVFKVLVSKVGDADTDFEYVDGGRLFVGNTVRNTPETVLFANPVQARYVRIEVQMWNQHISMRAGLFVIEGPPPPPVERWIPDPTTVVLMNPPDDTRAATSSHGNDKPGYRYNTGMLDSDEGWLSARNDQDQFYIMDAGAVMSIAGVVTQTRRHQNQYVNIYQVSVSNELRGPYTEVDNGAAFVGNTKNSDEKAEAMFLEPVEARYVKIEPRVWVGHMAMRCGLKVVSGSKVEVPALPQTMLLNPPDKARAASSVLHNHQPGQPYFASMLDSQTAWLSAQNVAGQYLTIDAGEMRPISAVVLQARKNTDQYVTKYKVLTSADADGPFTYVADGAEFIGNTRPNSDEKATARFPQAVAARFVRIEVVTWNAHMTMRAGLEYVRKPPPPYPCSKDGGECPCPGGEVYFGKAPETSSPSDKASFEAMLAITHAKTAGGKMVKCTTETFGVDPLPDKIKSCYCVPPLPALPVEVNPPDNARYMSSSYANDVPGYRYNTGMLDGQEGWLAGRNAAGEAYTMDAGAVMDIAGVVTQGRTNSAEQTTEFKVLVSNSERGPFKYVDGGEVFHNYAGYDVHTQTHFAEVVSARYVQIEAVKWNGRVAMRAGLLAMAGTEKPVSVEDTKTLAVANPLEDARDYSSVAGNEVKGTGHARSMLDSEQAWSAGKNSAGEWMTIDAGKKMTIEGVVTQSRRNSDQMVNRFKVSTSDELHGEYTYVADGGVFEGNTFRDEQVMVKFPEPIEARFVRIEAVTWNQHISMRAGLLYKPKDGETYMINPDEGSRHYSSVHGNQAPGTGHARSTLNSDQGWSAARNGDGEWMTIDSGAVQTIAGVTMQSRRNSNQMVQAFKVLVSSLPDSNFTYVDGGRMFVGNTVRNVLEKVVFADPVEARYVRIEVHMWNQYISMRAGLLVMEGPAPPPKKRVTADPSTVVLMNPPDDARIMSTSYGNDKPGYRYNTGMLDSDEGWLSARNDQDQFYIMDAGAVMSIAGVVTQNRRHQNQYVNFYKVSVSNELRGPYTEVDNGATFVGNTKNSDEKAEAMFLEPVEARYVKIEPKMWVGHMTMRCGLKVVSGSKVEVPALPQTMLLNPPDAARTASSVNGNHKSGTGYFMSMLDSSSGWSSAQNSAGQTLTVDAGEVRPISAVVLQARRNTDQYVTTLKILTSDSADGPFTYVAHGATFVGNTFVGNSEEKVEVRFPSAVAARFVRVEVITWNAHISMRAGLAFETPAVEPAANAFANAAEAAAKAKAAAAAHKPADWFK